MDRVKTRKGACYSVAAALILASAPLILALPATGAPCDPAEGIVPALICPPPPDRPKPKTTPVPTATATPAPAAPTAPPVTAPARRASAAPAPAVPRAAAPTAPGAQTSTENPQPITSPADGSPATPAPSAPAPAATAGPVAAEPPASGDPDGRSLTGALLLAFGGLLAIVWVFLDIRT